MPSRVALVALCACGALGLAHARPLQAQSSVRDLSGTRRGQGGVATQAESEDAPPPFALTAMAETSVGQGTFVADPNARNAYAAWSLLLLPSYQPSERLRLIAFLQASQELTDSDFDTHRQQLLLSDAQLRARYAFDPLLETGIHIALEGRLIVPTSLLSQAETLIVGTQARANASRAFGDFTLNFLTAFRKNFHRYTTPTVSVDASVAPPPIHMRAFGNEDLAGRLVSIGGNNASFSFYNELSLLWAFHDDWMAGIAYGLSNAFTYASYARDALSSPYAQDGRGQRDVSIGTLFVTWLIDERFTLAVGAATTNTPRSADNARFRFPFWDFESAASNATVFYVDFTLTEPFGE